MHIERIHKMIECLTEKALCELDKGVENVNTEEMGEAVDMIKDLCEAEYKAVIVKSMKKAVEEEEEYNKEAVIWQEKEESLQEQVRTATEQLEESKLEIVRLKAEIYDILSKNGDI